MRLTFSVDLKQCLINGIDCSSDEVTINTHPADIPEPARLKIAALYYESKVCKFDPSELDEIKPNTWLNPSGEPFTGEECPILIIAKAPTLTALIAAVEVEHERFAERQKQEAELE